MRKVEALILEKLKDGPISIKEAQQFEGIPRADIGAAFGNLKRAGRIHVRKGHVQDFEHVLSEHRDLCKSLNLKQLEILTGLYQYHLDGERKTY